MLISAICASLCYTAFTIVNKYYDTFRSNQKNIGSINLSIQLLRQDIDRSNKTIKTENGIACLSDSGKISYDFLDHLIIRSQYEKRTDTFNIQTSNLKTTFLKVETEPDSLLDQLRFEIQYDKKSMPISLYKIYSSNQLFN